MRIAKTDKGKKNQADKIEKSINYYKKKLEDQQDKLKKLQSTCEHKNIEVIPPNEKENLWKTYCPVCNFTLWSTYSPEGI
jgi:uncharacterized UBP type Zn finger protein